MAILPVLLILAGVVPAGPQAYPGACVFGADHDTILVDSHVSGTVTAWIDLPAGVSVYDICFRTTIEPSSRTRGVHATPFCPGGEYGGPAQVGGRFRHSVPIFLLKHEGQFLFGLYRVQLLADVLMDREAHPLFISAPVVITVVDGDMPDDYREVTKRPTDLTLPRLRIHERVV